MNAAAGRYFDTLVLHETRLWSMVERRLRATEGAVSLGRFEVLRTVGGADGAARVQDVAAALLITVGAASRIVERLVADGLIERAPHETDRRSHHLRLSPAGRRASDATTTAFDAALADVFRGLDDDRLAALHELLREADDALAHLGDADS